MSVIGPTNLDPSDLDPNSGRSAPVSSSIGPDEDLSSDVDFFLRVVAPAYNHSYPPDVLNEPGKPNATGAVENVGTAGDFQPSGCRTPSVQEMNTLPVVASPTAAWGAGSYMHCTNGNVTWDGTAWVPPLPTVEQASAPVEEVQTEQASEPPPEEPAAEPPPEEPSTTA